MFLFIGTLLYFSDTNARKPRLILNLSTDRFIAAMGRELYLTEDRTAATFFCRKEAEGVNDEMIQICEDEELEMNTEPQEEAPNASFLVEQTTQRGFVKKSHSRNSHAGLTITLEPVIESRRMDGTGVILEPESGNKQQSFQITELDNDTVRIANDKLCLSVMQSGGSVGHTGNQLVALPCDKLDKNNVFQFVGEVENVEPPRTIDEAKLAALKEVAKISPKLREKIGMDYLETLG